MSSFKLFSKSSYSPPYISPLPPPPFYRPTPNHPHSYAPDAQTISIFHASPHPPQHTLYTQKTIQIHTALSIFQRNSAHSSHHHPLQRSWKFIKDHAQCTYYIFLRRSWISRNVLIWTKVIFIEIYLKKYLNIRNYNKKFSKGYN